jgi:hypothetical protein
MIVGENPGPVAHPAGDSRDLAGAAADTPNRRQLVGSSPFRLPVLAGVSEPRPRVISLVAPLFLAVKDAASQLAALGPVGPSLTARRSFAGWPEFRSS